jgi:putative transcriptional regulator
MVRKWLLEIRESKDMTHEVVANLTGISRQYYSMIENGERNPSVVVAKRIAEVLGFNWIIFFEIQGNKTLHKQKVSTA